LANYINSPILFESYVHLDAHFDDADDAHESLSQELHEYLQERAGHFLYDSVTTDVKFKEGSIKAYATVRGSLRKCLGPVYEDFSKEIYRLYWFSKRLSDAAVMEVTFRTGTYLKAIERTEARPGIVGTTKRVIDAFLAIKQVENEKTALIVLRRIKLLPRAIKNLVDLLGYEEDVILIKTECRELLKTTPKRLGSRFLSEETEERYKDAIKKLADSIEEIDEPLDAS